MISRACYGYIASVIGKKSVSEKENDIYKHNDNRQSNDTTDFLPFLTNLEIFDGFNFQFQCCVFITNHQGILMLLKSTNCPHVIDTLLNSFVKCERFMCASD